jgi:hypothetical protein
MMISLDGGEGMKSNEAIGPWTDQRPYLHRRSWTMGKSNQPLIGRRDNLRFPNNDLN